MPWRSPACCWPPGAPPTGTARKLLLLAGLLLFGAGSLAAGLAETSGQLIAARAGMGVGGAMLVTSTLAVALQIFPAHELLPAIGIWAAVSALGLRHRPADRRGGARASSGGVRSS